MNNMRVMMLCMLMSCIYFSTTMASNQSNDRIEGLIKMRKFQQNKLWRDAIVDMLEKHGSIAHWQRLDDIEYDRQLKIKLIEEADEVRVALSRDELIQELADVYEVIDSLCAVNGISCDEIVAVQTKKRNERGGFSGRKFVTIAEHPQGSPGEKYCLAQPDKYPEVF